LFEPGLTVLLGENNIGKTNLLHAIRVALGPSATGDFVRLDEGDLHRRPDGTRDSTSVQIALEFAGLSLVEQGTFLDALNFNPSDPEASTASIHFEWTWSDQRRRGLPRRWGGNREDAEAPVPEDAMQSLRVVFLEALRDAERALAPGQRSRLARLLNALASESQRDAITSLIQNVNSRLEQDELVRKAQTLIRDVLEGASGPQLMQFPSVRSADPRFERVIQALRLVLEDPNVAAVISDIDENGLGYNNLLFIATVLSELDAAPSAGAKILLIEEPEAHLHPQLQVLLANYLQSRGGEAVQVNERI